jgi:hypothetical protein
MTGTSNKTRAGKGAGALAFHIGHLARALPDLFRSALRHGRTNANTTKSQMNITNSHNSDQAVRLLSALLTGCCFVTTAFAQSFPNSLWIGTDNTPTRQTLNTDRSGRVLRIAPPEEATGIAIDAANNRIFFGTHDGAITPHDLTTLGAGASITANTGWSEDLAFDGVSLWRAGLVDGTVYQVRPADGSLLSSFPVPFRPMGLAWDGGALWVSSQYGGLVARYDTNGTPTGQQFTNTLTETGGLAYDNTDGTLWIGTYNQVYHYSTNGNELGHFSFAPNDPGRFADGLEFQGPVATPFLSLDFYAGLTVLGNVGTTNQIQYVTSVADTNWIILTNVVLPQSPYLFFDLTSPRTQRRFYRAVQLP